MRNSEQNATTARQPAILLVGPTGAGKTPLGDELARAGFLGKRCVHCDFGVNLRAVDSGEWRPSDLSDSDRAVIRDSLQGGTLLENEHFHIAATVVRGVLARASAAPQDLLVLNGMPRHVEQADDVDVIAAVQAVVALNCPADVVRQRILLDSGGDRAGRVDDSMDEVHHKLETYRQRTLPLLDHYRALGVSIATITIGVDSQPTDVVVAAERALKP